MNPYYPNYTKKDSYQTRYYKNKWNYYQRRNRFQKNNNHWGYSNYKKINYEYKYEEEINYDKEANESSFSMSTHSNSRKNSYCENNNDNSEKNKKNNNNTNYDSNNHNNEIVPKINLSENVIKSAYFVPKNYKENKENKENKDNKDNKNITKNEDNTNKSKKKDENIVILAINIKISKDKFISFELRKYDDMFLIIQNFCEENKLNENIKKFLPRTIIKALNSIYGIMNLKLTNEEIAFINELRENYL